MGQPVNLLPAKYLGDRNELTPTRKRLTMYNDTMIKPLGTCKMEVLNPKNARSYHVEFVVVDSDRAVPILGNQTMQQMDLVRVQQHNMTSVNTSQACFTAEQLLKDYPDVFKVLESWRVSASLKSSMVLRQWFIHQGEFLWRSRVN